MVGKNPNNEPNSPVGIDSKKINTARRILDVFAGQSCFMAQIPSPPFADNHGPNDLFEPSPATGETVNFESILKDAVSEFSLELSPVSLADSDKQLGIESQTVLADWEYSLTVMKRLSERIPYHRSKNPL